MRSPAGSTASATPDDRSHGPDASIRRDPLGAIDILTRINRSAPDIACERRLIELRHSAVPQLGRRTRRASHPRPAPDPCPGVLLPEVDAADLTVEYIRGGVLHHGAVLARNVIGPPGVSRLVQCIDRALGGAADRRADLRMGNAPAHVDPWFSPFGRVPFALGMGTEWVRMIDSPRTMFEFTEQLNGLGRGLVAEYLGERPVMNSHKWTLRRITPDCGGAWHQDGRVIADGARVLNVWIALTRCGAGTGSPGLEVVPRRLALLPTGSGSAAFDWSIDHALLERVADGTICDPVYEPGDALIFDERAAHRTGHRPGLTTPRHAIEAWFFAPSTHHQDAHAFVF